MGRINMGRAIVGGLLAGLLINVSEFVLNTFVIAQDMEAATKAMGLPPLNNTMIMGFVVLGFLLGIATVWLYGAIRPRFGPGVSTAVTAALAVWFLAYAYPTAFMMILHIYPRKTMAIGLVWGLAEIVIAGVAGAWAYTEGSA
jgi:hypothetical protein